MADWSNVCSVKAQVSFHQNFYLLWTWTWRISHHHEQASDQGAFVLQLTLFLIFLRYILGLQPKPEIWWLQGITLKKMPKYHQLSLSFLLQASCSFEFLKDQLTSAYFNNCLQYSVEVKHSFEAFLRLVGSYCKLSFKVFVCNSLQFLQIWNPWKYEEMSNYGICWKISDPI